MTPSWQVIASDCLDAMRAMDEHSVDAVVTDPPYGLGFMGKEWDAATGPRDHAMARNPAVDAVNAGVSRQGGRQRASTDFQKRQARDARSYQEWCEAWGREALRVLRPCGLAVVFGGTRTYHRLTCGIEDAGFEIRDQLDWLYGSGFPKHPSALKPAHEPILLARKAGARSEPLNIDACRIEGEPWKPVAPNAGGRSGGIKGSPAQHPGGEPHDAGRWPANVIVDDVVANMLDEQTEGVVHSAGHAREDPGPGEYDGSTGIGFGAIGTTGRGFRYGDGGGASRFFYCAKPEAAERNVGLLERNPHPTVKPVELMRWLIRLVAPVDGVVLDPFTGSGTTGIAALREGRSFIGIERETDYVDIARARILGDAPLLNGVLEKMTPTSEEAA